jgi:hypothetical protein
MKLHLPDSSRASFVGAALLAIAAYAVFGFQHGFEEQVGWYLTLLLGAFVAAAISEIIRKTIPGAGRVAFWGLLIGLTSVGILESAFSLSRHTASFPTLQRVRKSVICAVKPTVTSH